MSSAFSYTRLNAADIRNRGLENFHPIAELRWLNRPVTGDVVVWKMNNGTVRALYKSDFESAKRSILGSRSIAFTSDNCSLSSSFQHWKDCNRNVYLFEGDYPMREDQLH